MGTERRIARVGNVAVGGLEIRRGHDGRHRLRRAVETQASHRLGANPRVFVTSLCDQELLRTSDPLPLVGEHPRGRRPGVGRLRLEHILEQALVDGMETLLEPEHLGPQPVGLGIGGDRGQPRLRGGEHLGLRPRLEVGTGAIAGAPFGRLELLEHFRNRLAGLRFGGQQRLLLVDEPVDAAVLVVAIGVALAVLHMADQRVGPVAKPERAIGADLRIDRPEMLVGALDQVEGGLRILGIVPHPLSLVAGAVVGDRPARHTVGVDHAGIEKLVLHVGGKLPRP